MAFDLNCEGAKIICSKVDEMRDFNLKNGRFFWEHPELGYLEKETGNYAVETLKKFGYQVKTGLSVTGFRADLDTGRPGPTLAIFGELDALGVPDHFAAKNGAAHACGHHTHINSMLGAACALANSPVLKEMCGKIAFIGCPAEEGLDLTRAKKLLDEKKIKAMSGKVSMFLEGVLDDVDISFMNHAGRKVGCSINNGNVKKQITIHGKSAHAAACPQNGINALSVMTLIQDAIALMREHFTSDVRVHGIVTSGGSAANVIPDFVKASYYCRGNSVESMAKTCRRFNNIVKHCAAAMDATAEINTFQGSLPVKANHTMAELHHEIGAALYPDQVNSQAIFVSFGSTDMGDMSQIMPAIHGNVPGAQGTAHGVDFCVPDDDNAYIKPVKFAALMAYELLKNNAAAAKAAMAEFGPKLTREAYCKINDSLLNPQD